MDVPFWAWLAVFGAIIAMLVVDLVAHRRAHVTEPFLVFTANAFAILGLRAMYFLLADLVHRFVYLKLGLSAVLIWVGVKMLLLDVVKIPTSVSLAVVATIIAVAVAASLRATRGQGRRTVEAAAAGAFRIADEAEMAQAQPLLRRRREGAMRR